MNSRRIIALLAIAMAFANINCTKPQEAKPFDLPVDSGPESPLAYELNSERRSVEQSAKLSEQRVVQLSDRAKSERLDVEARERALVSMNEQALVEQENFRQLQVQKEAVKRFFSEENAKLEKELAAIEKERTRLKKIKKQTKATKKKLNDLVDREKKVLARRDELQGIVDAVAKTESSLSMLKVSLERQQAQLADSVQATRQLFDKNQLGDVFSRIESDKKMVFLVRIIGYGSQENLDMIRSKVDALTSATSRYKKLNSLPKIAARASVVKTSLDPKDAKPELEASPSPSTPAAASPVTASDSILVEANARDVKAIRDQIESELTERNRNGEHRNFNSFWLVVRPVEKVRAGLKISLFGSKTKYLENGMENGITQYNAKRTSGLIAEFNNIHSGSQQVAAIENLDLARPGTYIFNANEAQVCEKFNRACLDIIAKAGMLNNEMTMTIDTQAGPEAVTASRKEVMGRLMLASIEQTLEDLKGKTIIGIGTDEFDRLNFSGVLTTRKGALKFVKESFGFGSRAPVIDSMTLGYTVGLVEQINPVFNHMDAFQFLSSSVVGDVKMLDLTEGRRGEISIPLPINEYQVSRTSLRDLTLADFPAAASAGEPSQEVLEEFKRRSFMNAATLQNLVDEVLLPVK